MVGPVNNEESSLSPNTDNIQQQQHYRLQLLAQAIEKVESECSQKQVAAIPSAPKKQQAQHQIPIDSLSMTSSPQQQELLMQLFAQQNVAAVMAAAAAAAQRQVQQQQQKLEPISPPSTSSASSTAESPIDFSSRRSTDDINECSTPPSLSSPLPNQQQLLSTMLQSLQSTNNFPFLLTNKNGKPTRPFKAYPREPLMLPLGFCSNTTSEQTNILADAASRATPNRKRLAQTQERLKQRLQQQQLLSTTHFISSSSPLCADFGLSPTIC
jgi:formate dehydrogenase maturation protein FdhE